MSGTITAEEPPSTSTRVEGASRTTEKSAARETSKAQEIGSTENISLAEKMRAAFEEKPSKYWRDPPKGTSGNAAYMVLYVNINDIRAWSQLYGPAPAVALATFGRKSVWKMQAELLGRPGRPGPGDSGDPDNPNDPGGSGSPGDAGDPNAPYCPGRINDPAAEEYKRTIEAESGRITVSVCILIGEPHHRE